MVHGAEQGQRTCSKLCSSCSIVSRMQEQKAAQAIEIEKNQRMKRLAALQYQSPRTCEIQ